jgi:phage/plasmid-associated DNA primase
MSGESASYSTYSSTFSEDVNANVTESIQKMTIPAYSIMATFLRQFVSQDDNANIIDQGKKQKYFIPETQIPDFFKLLEDCRTSGAVMNLSEKQLEHSGIMLDFDILQENDKSQLTYSHFYTITQEVLIHVLKIIVPDTDKFTTNVMILRKKKLEYKEVGTCYKDGFHILIPGIKVKREVKKYLIEEILKSGVLKHIFDDVEFIGDINNIMDKNSAHVVTLFPGSCKSGKKPYDIECIYKVEIKKSNINNMAIFNYENTNMNLAYEFSINYNNDEGMCEKKEYGVNETVTNAISQWSNKKMSEEYDKKDGDLSILSMHDPDSKQLKLIIDILGVHRCDEYVYWFGIMCALAYTHERYKDLAYYFSGKREKGVRSEFERVWLNATMNLNKYAYSKEMIYSYAKKDNPEQYRRIMSEGVFGKLVEFMFDQKIGGNIDHWHIAQLLKEMVGNKFVVDFNENNGSLKWYEFVLEDDKHSPGEVYKWRCCDDPHTLRNYISAKMPIIFDRMLEFLNERKDNAADEIQIKYYANLVKVTIFSCRKLYNNGFKGGVIREGESIFRKTNFTKQLDKDENIMGVGNGVLSFDKVPTLIETHHQFKISRYTSVNYKKMDPTNTVVRQVFKSIWDLFPEGEKDAFHYIMFFMSTSLTGRLKACLFLTLRGNGANGKSYLMELVRNVLGAVMDGGYGCKLPIQYLIEREPMSNNASPVLVPLTWARLTYFSESDKSEKLRVSKKKQLTSHEPINVRALYGNQQNIIHKSNFILETNYALIIDSWDHGTWRREKYYTMKKKFCKNPNPENAYEEQDDPSFSVLKARDPEFLSGMLSILAMYLSILDMKYDGNINSVRCDTIARETEAFRNSQDIINRFITERVVKTTDDTYEMPYIDLIDNYCRWYDSNVKEHRHDRLDICLMFKNSRLSDAISKKINGTLFIIGHRVLGPEEEMDPGEEYLVEPMQDIEELSKGKKKVGDDTVYPTSNDVLQKTYDDYVRLIEENDIENW